MPDAFSISAAARRDGERPGLRAEGRTYTFRELAAMTRERIGTLERPPEGRPFALVGRNDVATVVTLYALLELDLPALLLHPRLTPSEQRALLDAAACAGPLADSNALAVLHTSGTTGAPRAAVLSRPAFLASAAASEGNLGWRDDDCWLLCMPVAHVGGLSILTRCLAARRCVALAPAFDPASFPDVLEVTRTTLLSLVPTMLTRVLDARPAWRAPERLRAILLGGSPASPRLLARAKERRLPALPSYGLTETCSQVTAVPYAARFDPAACGSGLPLAGAQVRIRDDGHIEINGPMLMHGYWGEPALGRDAWLDTRDLGALDARGCLHVYARRHDLIVTGGENVYPVEVENALEACPGVDEAGVFGVPDDVWGERVVAVLTGSPSVATTEAIVSHVRARLAPHKWPRHIAFVGELPHTRAGKLDRAALQSFASSLHPLAYEAPAR